MVLSPKLNSIDRTQLDDEGPIALPPFVVPRFTLCRIAAVLNTGPKPRRS